MGKIPHTDLGGINYSVVRGRRKSISLKFNGSSNLIISIPRYSLVNIERLIDDHRSWIIKHSSEIASSKNFVRGEEVLYAGSYCRMEFREKVGRPRVTKLDNTLIVESEGREAGIKAVSNFMKKQTEEMVEPILAEKLRASGREAKSVKYRKMRKWGYCTSDRRIKFNAYLSMLPVPIIDYIVSHEVSHLIELNHSKDFWKVVSGFCPSYKELRKELKSYNVGGRII
ncbi:MAG: M48 family metallopeptidase [Candidatus Micrarchaeota archaeon]|nr:M48 family metallopeptidase [Candidatus Micrarchaeota archaeon]